MNAVPATRIVHLHIAKTAGTAVRWAFKQASGGKLRISPHFHESKYAALDPSDFDFFSGHFGFNTAARFDGQIITVVRNPVDRFVSFYYFLRQQFNEEREKSPRARLATNFSLSEFVKIRDEPCLLEPFHNAMTWQIASSVQLLRRRELRLLGKTDDDIVKLALTNLATFSLVGIQEDLGVFADALSKKFAVSLKLKKVNVTPKRATTEDIGAATIHAIREWNYMDLVVYEHAVKMASNAAEARRPA